MKHITTCLGLLLAAGSAFAGEARLGDLDFESAAQGWGQLGVDRAVGGTPLSIGGRAFAHGLGTHANSEIVYELGGAFTNFSAWVGVDDNLKNHPEAPKASVVFQVFADGAKLFDSGVMRMGDAAKEVSVPLADVEALKLVVADAGDGISCDHANWAEPLLGGRTTEDRGPTAKYQLETAGLTLQLDDQGRIVGSSTLDLSGQTRLGGCRSTGEAAVVKTGGGYAFTRQMSDAQGHTAAVTDRFTPTRDSIRWEVEIVSTNALWTTGIETRIETARAGDLKFWTAWGTPPGAGGPWSDPLAPASFPNQRWHYGNVAQNCPVGSDYIALPLATVMDPAADKGVSLVLSPDDVLLNLDLGVSAAGRARFTRTSHRLGAGRPLRFTLHLVPHEASWRGGLRFMTARYPQFFEAPNPRAHRIAGCGAYSTGEQEIDVGKFRKMAFGFNWKLSDDFPYMGMFIPPVKDADEKWNRSCDERSAAYKGPTSSCRQMNDYARYMKTNGFAVLSYFNVTEFGKNMYGRQPVKSADDPDLWQDPAGYIKYKLPDAIVDPNIGTCYRAYIVDVGDADYGRFMLEQAARNTRMLPDVDGICIDRADWLHLYNRKADDGVSWINSAPARSLFRSWVAFMAQLGPQMHKADKVIFSNMMTMRLELCRELDGIYTEFGNNGNALNASSLLGLRKPVVCWTYNETLNEPGPDAFMQRHLHMGCFPTAPYPANNHCINPEPKADQLYLDYGPLLDAMRGKKWVLAEHGVETTTPGAKVNLFEVPGGYALPVTFGGAQTTAVVRLRNLPGLDGLTAAALHPGGKQPAPVAGTMKDGALELRVPLSRGCAMVTISRR